MPQSEIHDIHTMILQLRLQNINLIYEVSMLKQGTWQKAAPYIISGISLISSYFLAYGVSKWTYKNQRKLEAEKRIEENVIIEKRNKDKRNDEKNDLMRKLHGEFTGYREIYINSINLMNYHNIRSNYFSWKRKHTDDKIQQENYKSNENKSDEYYFEATGKVIEMQYKLNSILAEYYILNPKTIAYASYGNIKTKDYKYSYEEKFDTNHTDKQAKEYMQFLIDESAEFIANKISVHTNETSQKMSEEILQIIENK